MTSNKSVKIYVVGFDTVGAPASEMFVPIQAGRAINFHKLDALGDDTNDNISHLNPLYAEMTAMYWVWKNAPKSDYVGFFHYRRFLDLSPRAAVKNSDSHFSDFGPLTRRQFGWTEEAILAALADADIIVPPLDDIGNPQDGYKSTCSIYEQYLCYHVARDMDLTVAEAKKRTPPHLVDKALASHGAVFNHIYVMRWDLFEEYMAWCFSILEAVRPQIALDEPVYGKGQPQSRALGFLGERLLNVFLDMKKDQGIRVRHASRVFARHLPGSTRKMNWPIVISRALNRSFAYRKIPRGFYAKAFGVSLLFYRPY